MGSVDIPFFAINTVHHHLDQIIRSEPKLKQLAAFIKNCFHVDNLIEMTDTAEEAIRLREDIQNMFAMMKIRITKWSSNSAALLKIIPKGKLSPYEEIQDPSITIYDPEIISQTTKCLGMTFSPKEIDLITIVMKNFLDLRARLSNLPEQEFHP